MSKKGSKKQFCTRGHDKDVVGRQGLNCRECSLVAAKKRYLSSSDSVKSYWRLRVSENNWKKFGIANKDGSQFARVDYDSAYAAQGGKCFGCERHQSELDRSLAADHNHTTGVFRGLLCRHCNTSLGMVRDSADVLRRLIHYLEK